MKTVLSKATKMRVPSGRLFWISSAVARAARATSRLFAVEVLMIAEPDVGLAVAAIVRTPFFGGALDPGDVAEPHEVAALSLG